MDEKTKKSTELEKSAPSHLMTPFEELERWFDEAMPLRRLHRWGWPSLGELTRPLERIAPRVNVIDRDDEIVVRVEVPGVKKEDLDITLTDNTVTIKGETRREEKEEKGDYYRCEIASGAFTRTVGLPNEVDTDKAKSSFKDGLLELKLPKTSKTKRRRIKLD